MTTLSEELTHCPVCAEEVTVHHVMSTNNFGGQDTDFRSRPVGFDPLHFVMTQCPTCGYSGFGSHFSEPRPMTDDLKARIRAEVKPLAGDEKKISRVYATAAQIAQMRNAPSEELAHLYLRAAWCCADEDDPFGEIYHRKQAINHFQAALENQEVDAGDRLPITYLVGELYRRVGDADNARLWFDRAISMCEAGEASWLCEFAERQRDNPKGKF